MTTTRPASAVAEVVRVVWESPLLLEEEAMRRAVARVVCGLTLIVAAIGAVFILGMRRKSSPVLDAVRRMNR